MKLCVLYYFIRCTIFKHCIDANSTSYNHDDGRSLSWAHLKIKINWKTLCICILILVKFIFFSFTAAVPHISFCCRMLVMWLGWLLPFYYICECMHLTSDWLWWNVHIIRYPNTFIISLGIFILLLLSFLVSLKELI